jgi:multicomponent Na+:H+ antiporter subunit E
MTELLRPRRISSIVTLTLVWCFLWGSFSFAHVAGGVVIGAGIVLLGVGTEAFGSIRPIPLAKLIWIVAIDLIKSTVNVAYEILTPTDYTEEAIVAVDVPLDTRSHLLLLIVAVTVTPGTAVVDADPDRGRLYLHLLHVNRVDSTVEHVLELAELACRALPVSGDLEVSS